MIFVRPRTREPAVPTDEEILSLDNVPVDITARYLGWTEQNVRLALREARAPFGIAIPGNKGALTYKISHGGLVKYKREGAPVMSYETLVMMVKEAVAGIITPEVESLRADLFN